MAGAIKRFFDAIKKRGSEPITLKSDREEAEFSARYQAHLLADTTLFRMRGLSPQAARLALDACFADLRFETEGKADLGPQGVKELGGNRSVWVFLRSERLPPGVPLAVLGPTGSGKTALLQHVALTLLLGRQERHGCRPLVPIFLSLHKVGAAMAAAPSLEEFLQGYYADEENGRDLDPPQGHFGKLLKQGKCVVLLDALDEIVDTNTRFAVARWVAKQAETYPATRILIASRPFEFRGAAVENVHVLEVQALKGEQGHRFLEHWYNVHESTEGTKSAEEIRQAVNRKANDLWSRLRRDPLLGKMTNTPLLLDMLALAHSRRGGLSDSAVETYALVCAALLQRWQRHGGLKDKGAEQVLGVLRALSAHLMKGKARQWKGTELARLLPGGDEAKAEALLHELQEHTGLVLEKEAQHWRFAHPTFQDYLAAEKLREGGQQMSHAGLVSDSFYHQMLRFYASLGDSTALMQSCLQQRNMDALTLASMLMEEAKELQPAVRAAAVERLVTALDSEDDKRRHLAEEARLQRRLRSMYRIDDQREIDLTYVTCAEYQLFVDELKDMGFYLQPDHWTSQQHPAGQAQAPISGVRATDAQRFCEWLTWRKGDGLRFRLPRREEVLGFPAQLDSVSSWCQDGEAFALVGMSAKNEQLIREQLGKLPILGLSPALPIERDLNQRLDPDLLSILDLKVDGDTARSLKAALDRILDLLANRAIGLAAVIDPDVELARLLMRVAAGHSLGMANIERFSLDEARRKADAMREEWDEATARFGTVLGEIVDAARSEDRAKFILAQRRYIARLAEYAYQDYGKPREGDLEMVQRKHMQQAALEYHGWLQILIARLDGALPTWEGIRIVREVPTGNVTKTGIGGMGLPAWAYGH